MKLSPLNPLPLFLAVFCTGQISAQVVINEILADNDSSYNSAPNRFVPPVYPDVIELRNLSAQAVDLSGFHLSDKVTTPMKWSFPAGTSIPANGYLIILANGENSGLQTNFKLSASGESVLLSEANGTLIQQVDFERQLPDISYGRLSTGDFAFLPNPTIDAANDESGASIALVKRPKTDQESGVYTAPITVTLDADLLPIRYTIDGSKPTISSPLYTGPLNISDTTVLKSIAIGTGTGLVSDVAARTFLFNVSHALPLVILTPDELIDRKDVNDSATINEGVYSLFDIDGRTRFDFLETDGSLARHDSR